MILLCFSVFSCQKKHKTEINVYKGGEKIKEYTGSFYTTKYGGLNYYIDDQTLQNELFSITNIDSILVKINNRYYVSYPYINKAFSRQINDSDFSFPVDERKHKILIDTINKMNTLMIYSAKTDIEEMKDKKEIKFTFIDE